MLEFLKSPNGARLQAFVMAVVVAILVHYFPDAAPYIAAATTGGAALGVKRPRDHQ